MVLRARATLPEAVRNGGMTRATGRSALTFALFIELAVSVSHSRSSQSELRDTVGVIAPLASPIGNKHEIRAGTCDSGASSGAKISLVDRVRPWAVKCVDLYCLRKAMVKKQLLPFTRALERTGIGGELDRCQSGRGRVIGSRSITLI